MKAHIMNDGDMSVGIDGATIEIDMPRWMIDNEDDNDREAREGTRHILQEAFAQLFDVGETYVLFNDEEETR